MRALARPLYDFRGVRAFKERLRPSSWQGVWLAHPRGELTLPHMVEALRAFAGGSLWRFGLRTAIRHPGVAPLVLALPLAPWTAVLAVRAAADMTMLLGWSREVLAAWAAFDALLCVALFQVAMRPSPRHLLALAGAALFDAAVSLHHLLSTGLGTRPVSCCSARRRPRGPSSVPRRCCGPRGGPSPWRGSRRSPDGSPARPQGPAPGPNRYATPSWIW